VVVVTVDLEAAVVVVVTIVVVVVVLDGCSTGATTVETAPGRVGRTDIVDVEALGGLLVEVALDASVVDVDVDVDAV
jgi:hypothetical protein